MKKAVVIDTNDMKAILAEKFGVPIESVIKSQYSFTVVMEEPGERREACTKHEPEQGD